RARPVGAAGGPAPATAGGTGGPVSHHSPNEGKQAAPGDGTADKAQVQPMVARLLSLERTPRPADAADALGLAVCHLGSAGLRGALAAGGSVPGGLGRAIGAALAKEARR